MFIYLHKLMDVPVVTESGDKLGKVYDVEMDIETHAVRTYYVRNLLRSSAYLIKPSQIKSITLEKIVVHDAVVKGGSSMLTKNKKSSGAEMAGSTISAREEG